MKTEKEIIDLSDIKINAADILVKNGFLDDGLYLAGYAFELLLKAKICKTLLLPDFFDFENSRKRSLSSGKVRRTEKENLYKPFKVHDYEQLLILSGLFSEFENLLKSDPVFLGDWSVISKWDESLRYSTGANQKDVESFIQSIKNMKKWILTHL